jgi:tRNA threonylcarbamoyladenosine biosynthesis protein TsaB
VTPLILAVDTTGVHGSLALARGGETVEEMAISAPTGFAQVLYGCIRDLLGRNRVALADISCFATACGPGSFTGVRVGLACVKGLAEATGKPAAGVSNLEAVARFGRAPLRAAVLDARRGDIYAAVYDEAGAVVVPETVAKTAAWAESLPPGVEFVAMDWTGLDSLPESPRVTAPRELAAMIARIALTREWQDPAALDANYVRRSDAELFWKEY